MANKVRVQVDGTQFVAALDRVIAEYRKLSEAIKALNREPILRVRKIDRQDS